MSPRYSNPWRVIRTPMSDALTVALLKGLERQLATLERAPTRRRKSPAHQLKQLRTINTLIKSFAWLMQRYEAMLRERENHPPESDDAIRKELKRRLEQHFAELDEAESRRG